jgi:diacylglycerol O-acyltransferase
LIPVNQRTRATTGGANQVSGYLCDLPIAQPDPAARLAAVRQAMHANKATGSRQGAGAVALQPAGSSPQA